MAWSTSAWLPGGGDCRHKVAIRIPGALVGVHGRARTPSREHDPDVCSPPAAIRDDLDLAAVEHHDVSRDRQPHASASLLARVEGLEDPLGKIRGDPWSVVREHEMAGIPTRRGFDADLRLPYAMKPLERIRCQDEQDPVKAFRAHLDAKYGSLDAIDKQGDLSRLEQRSHKLLEPLELGRHIHVMPAPAPIFLNRRHQ